ncbi:unnamed protein product [Prorocentrum cordatum]|uniref:Secreted protein n=1 Tax=Prorocentrum cordatum TaxID=2364126 RepID=A0ABN9W3C0_9DINO|nr:unnamed protein product [Polarella glacialis]
MLCWFPFAMVWYMTQPRAHLAQHSLLLDLWVMTWSAIDRRGPGMITALSTKSHASPAPAHPQHSPSGLLDAACYGVPTVFFVGRRGCQCLGRHRECCGAGSGAG